MKLYVTRILVSCYTSIVMVGVLPAGKGNAHEPGVATDFTVPELPGTIYYSFEGSTQYDRFSSSTDTVFPLFFSDAFGTYLFGTAKQTFHSRHGANEFNYGIGIRQLFLDSFIIGLNFFYDKRKSPTHHFHYQRGYGFEFLSEYLDARFNYYDPVNKPRRLGSAQGFYLGSNGVMRWETTAYEEALEGFDFEIGGPLPVKHLKTRVYTGASFYDSKISQDIRFFNIRTETRLTDWFLLDFSVKIPDNHNTFNDDDRVYFTGGFRIEIPFELGNLFPKKNPICRNARNPKLKQRLFQRVVRDLDIQTRAKENVDTHVEKNLIYIDNRNQSGVEDGSLAHPFSSLTNALASSQYSHIKSLYVFKGDGSAYTGNYTLTDGTLLWGSGSAGLYNIPTQGYPLLQGAGTDPTVTIAGNTEITGLQISGAGGNNGIYGRSLENVLIHDTIISGNQTGIYIDSAVDNVRIIGNTIQNNSADGIYCYEPQKISIIGNTISGNGDGIELFHPLNDILISGNCIENNTDDGIYAFMIEEITISDNTISNNANGIRLYEYDVLSDITMSNNAVSGNTSNDTVISDSPGFSLTSALFYEYYNDYTLGVNPNDVSNWFVFGLEHLDRYVVGNADNKWLNIIFDSPAGGVPPAWVSYGLGQQHEWNPNKDFTAATIQFDISSDLAGSISNILAVQVTAICNETGTLKTFRTPDANLLTVPSAADGWVPVSVNASDLSYNEAGWATPDLTQVQKVEILFLQTTNDFVAAGNIYIDNFKATK